MRPAPTGALLHSAACITAFNYLFAYRRGRCIQNIRGTDSPRRALCWREEYIIESFRWLGFTVQTKMMFPSEATTKTPPPEQGAESRHHIQGGCFDNWKSLPLPRHSGRVGQTCGRDRELSNDAMPHAFWMQFNSTLYFKRELKPAHGRQ